MKNFLNKQREILALLAFAAIIGGLVWLVILPLLSRISDTNDQIQQEIIKQEGLTLYLEQLPTIEKQYETLSSSSNLKNVLLDKEKAVVLIEKLEKLAEKTNNKITIAVQESAAPVKKAVDKKAAPVADTLAAGLPSQDYLQLKITLTGDYSGVVNFISALEKFEYYSDVTSIQINKETLAAAQEKQLSNIGMFSSVASIVSASKEVRQVVDSNALTAILDTVFYTN